MENRALIILPVVIILVVLPATASAILGVETIGAMAVNSSAAVTVNPSEIEFTEKPANWWEGDTTLTIVNNLPVSVSATIETYLPDIGEGRADAWRCALEGDPMGLNDETSSIFLGPSPSGYSFRLWAAVDNPNLLLRASMPDPQQVATIYLRITNGGVEQVEIPVTMLIDKNVTIVVEPPEIELSEQAGGWWEGHAMVIMTNKSPVSVLADIETYLPSIFGIDSFDCFIEGDVMGFDGDAHSHKDLYRHPDGYSFRMFAGIRSPDLTARPSSPVPQQVGTIYVNIAEDPGGAPLLISESIPVTIITAPDPGPYPSCFAVNELKIETKAVKTGKCKGVALLEVTSNVATLVYKPDPGRGKLRSNTIVDDGVNGPVRIHTSCSRPLEIGDVFGAYTVTDLVKIFDGGAGGNGNEVKIKGTFNPAVPANLAFDEVTFVIDDGVGHTIIVYIPAGSFIVDGKPEDEKFKYDSGLGSEPHVEVKVKKLKCEFELKAKNVPNVSDIVPPNLVVTLEVGANIGQELVVVEVKGKHLEYKKKPKENCCPPEPVGDYCDDHAKPKVLTMEYTGDDCSASSHSQGSKASCEDFGALLDPVYIVAQDKKGKCVWFEGPVAVGDTFDIDASNAGKKKLDSEVLVKIYNPAGDTLLQEVKIHTSCSQPLYDEDQFGSLMLVGFVAE